MENLYKYPRTLHLPWSPGATNDDKIMTDLSPFIGKSIVVTEKMDGENTTMLRDRIHARSLDSNDHPSRHWVKGLWGSIKHEIPDGWRICGENLYARHSIGYSGLPTYFMVFSIWNDSNQCLSWKETIEVCQIINLTPVPLIREMTFDEKWLREYSESIDTQIREGFVVRNTESFHYDDFKDNVAKWVRMDHVTSDSHWMFQEIVPNGLMKL